MVLNGETEVHFYVCSSLRQQFSLQPPLFFEQMQIRDWSRVWAEPSLGPVLDRGPPFGDACATLFFSGAAALLESGTQLLVAHPW